MSFVPSDAAIPLALWLEPDAGTVYSDAGVTPATDGQTIRQWNDRSGNGVHLSQATAGSRPTYLAPVYGDIGAGSISSTSLANSGATFPSGSAALDVFVVGERGAGDALLRFGTTPSLSLRIGAVSQVITFPGGNLSIVNDHPDWFHNVTYDGGQANASRLTERSNGRVMTTGSLTGTVPTTLAAENGVALTGGTGRVRIVLVYAGVLSSGDRASVVDYLQRRYREGTRPLLVGTGASWTTQGWVSHMPANLPSSWDCLNMGLAGSTIANWLAFSGFTYPLPVHPYDVEVCALGHNDLASGDSAATIEANLTTYWASRVTAGFQVVGITCFGTSDVDGNGHGSTRTAVNTWVKSQVGDKIVAVVDLDADSRFSDYTNATYFVGDGVHLTSAGYQAFADDVWTVMQTLKTHNQKHRAGRGYRLGSRMVA